MCATFKHWRRFEMNRRRRMPRDQQLWPAHPEPGEPCTFGLSEHELRKHANDLHAAGWAFDEIESVLAVQRVP
jgi:hypothetical protein